MSTPMIPEQRQQEILRMLRDDGVLSTRALTEALEVSHMTIRRDIATLEDAGLVTAVQGGVRIAQRIPKEPPRHRATRHNLELHAKAAIARAAASHVRDGMVLFLDAGTTCETVVPHLSDFAGLTVVTNDFQSVALLTGLPRIEVIHTGGPVDHDRGSSNGPLAAATVQRLAIDLYLMSTGTWDKTFGVTVPVADTALLKEAVLAASVTTILLADATKFGASERYRVAPLERLNMIISDDRLPPDAADHIRGLGVELTLAPCALVGIAVGSSTV